MSMVIYISPSNQPHNRYAYGDTNEKEQMEILAGYIKRILDHEYLCTTRIATTSLSINPEGRPREAKSLNSDVYLALHSNAGGRGQASGAMAFYYPGDTKSKLLAENIVRELNEICPIRSNRSSPVLSGMAPFNGQGLAEVRNPVTYGMITVLAETDFHDNPQTAEWIVKNHESIARAYVAALVKSFDIKPKQLDMAELAKTAPEKLYKVQLGAFRNRANADFLLERLRRAGFDGYIKYE